VPPERLRGLTYQENRRLQSAEYRRRAVSIQ
jgi:hypothetical protein